MTTQIMKLLFDAYELSALGIKSSGLVVTQGVWHLNTEDAWRVLEEMEANVGNKYALWMQGLRRRALESALDIIIFKLTICGCPVRSVGKMPTTVVLWGKKPKTC